MPVPCPTHRDVLARRPASGHRCAAAAGAHTPRWPIPARLRAGLVLCVLVVHAPFGCGDSGGAAPCSDCADAACAPGDWTCGGDVLHAPAHFDGHLSLAAGPDGSVAFAYHDAAVGSLVVGRVRPGEPPREIVADTGAGPRGVGRYTDCAFDPQGRLHVVYQDVDLRQLRHAVLDGLDVVRVETVDEAPDTGYRPALAVDPASRLHVTYYDATERALRYARLDETWTRETLPPPPGDATTHDYGSFSDVALRAGHPIVAYYDRAGGNLVLAERSGGQWSAQIVDGVDPLLGTDSGDVGRWPSLHVDDKGNVSVAYQDAGHGALRFATAVKGELRIETIDDGARQDEATGARREGIVGAFAALVVPPAGTPRVYYLDGTTMRVRRRLRSDTGWGPAQGPDTTALAGLWLDAVVLTDGSVAVAYERWVPVDEGDTVRVGRSMTWWFDP